MIPTGRVQLVNDSLRKGFGLAGNLRGQTIMEVFRWHELAALSERLPREKILSGVELDLQRGVRRSWQVSAALVSDRPGGPQGQLFVFHDVTRLKELESIRKEFVGNVSHELRTPLSLIKGFAQTLLDGALHDPEQAERFLQKIDKHSDRLLFLIEDLLAISRLESGQVALNLQPVNLRDMAQRVVDDLGAPAAARQTSLVNRIPAALSVRADADRLPQVFFNLTENAIKYGKSGGRVLLDARETGGGKVEVLVSDDGPGIPPEALGRILSGSTAWTAPVPAKAAAPAWVSPLSNILSRPMAARPGSRATLAAAPPSISPSPNRTRRGQSDALQTVSAAAEPTQRCQRRGRR